MKEFILLVRVPVSYTSEQAKAADPEWTKLLDRWKKDCVYVTSFVFPTESFVVSGRERTTKNEFVISENKRVVSSIVLLAQDMKGAIELAKACPVLEYGGSIEVREVQPRAVTASN